MKRVLLILSFLSVFLCMAYCGEYDERVWAYNGEQNIIINLENTFYCPRYSTKWKDNSEATGTYVTLIGTNGNGIGNIGVAACTHNITFTVTTDGRFVSQSDPTKYREYYIALKPRARDKTGEKFNSDGTDWNYYYDVTSGSYHLPNELVPNTRNRLSVSVTAPAFNPVQKQGNTIVLNDPLPIRDPSYIPEPPTDNVDIPAEVHPMRVYYDVLLCMDQLTSQDKTHLAHLDDYIAKVSVDWNCDEEGCDVACHHGSFVFVIRGQYQVKDPSTQKDNVYMIVTPDPSSSSINIMSLINNPSHKGQQRIAGLQILTTNLKGANWNNNVKAFISSSPNYNVSGGQFVLRRYVPSDPVREIPYKVVVYNEGYTGNDYNQVYDGTDVYSTTTKFISFSGNMRYETDEIDDNGDPYTKITYSDVNKQTTARDGSNSNAILLNADVMIEIEDDENGTLYQNRSNYSGAYCSFIYYHIVYSI